MRSFRSLTAPALSLIALFCLPCLACEGVARESAGGPPRVALSDAGPFTDDAAPPPADSAPFLADSAPFLADVGSPDASTSAFALEGRPGAHGDDCARDSDCTRGRCIRATCTDGRDGDACESDADCRTFCDRQTQLCGQWCVDPRGCF